MIKHLVIGIALMLALTGCAFLRGVWCIATSCDEADATHTSDGRRQ